MRRRLKTGGPSLAVTYLVSEVCGLLRIAVFAHVLAPGAMGAVVILGTWVRLVEMVTDLSLDRYLLRAPDGAARRVQSVAHGTAVLRGLFGTGFMLASLLPLMTVYGLHDWAWAFAAASLVPLLRGFTHLDYRLHNRMLHFGSTITVEVASALAGLAAAASVFFVPGPTAFAAALLVQAGTAMLFSHVLAERSYAIAFDRGIQRRIWQAGWPLAFNALLLYAVFQGEKLLVGGVLGLEVLGTYAIAAQLALLPVMIAGRLSIGIGLPVLARAGATTLRGLAARKDVVQFFLAGGIMFWLGFVAIAPLVIKLLFGAEYAQSSADISWIAAAAALRLQKTGPATVLLAAGRSRDILAGNSARIGGLLIGTLGMILTRDLTLFLAFTAAGEALSYATAGYRASPGKLSLLLPLPVMAIASIQAAWPYAPGLTLPLAGLMAAASALILMLMAARHLKGFPSKLQQAGG
jgi:O-antigen/teichoic acid export membrane protein